jgi:hypothetical protein
MAEKIETILCSITSSFFFRKSCLLGDNEEILGTAKQATYENVTRRKKNAIRLPDN